LASNNQQIWLSISDSVAKQKRPLSVDPICKSKQDLAFFFFFSDRVHLTNPKTLWTFDRRYM